MSEAYSEGCLAGESGWDSTYNPYPRKSQDAAEWEKGRLEHKESVNEEAK